MIIPDEWKNIAKNKVDEILKEVSDSFQLKGPVPILDIIESYLGDVCIISKMNYPFPEGVSAFSQKDMRQGWIIAINENEIVERQRFSAAHELAHIVLFTNNPNMVFCSKESSDWTEKLCDRFAGDILMPEEMVRSLYKLNPLPYLEDVAKTFKVSRPVAEIQLKRLNLAFKYKFD
jgi:Zn-dependent peptidase ImmA (M78 family)